MPHERTGTADGLCSPRAASPLQRPSASRADVIVVGGGPAGSSSAWHLSRLGLRVLLVDKARFPREKACAEYLSPEANRIMGEMGALEPVLAAGAAGLRGMRIRSPDGTWLHGEFATTGSSDGRDRGLAIRRHLLDTILLERAALAGATIRQGLRVTGLVRDANGRVHGVEVLDESGAARVLHAPLVIGADGLRSVVSRRLNLAHRSRMPHRLAFVGHFRGVAGIGRSGEMHVEHDGFIGMANVGSGVSNAALVVPAEQARAAIGDPAGFLESWIGRHPHLETRFRNAERIGDVLTTGPFASHARSAWAPGAALVGDAADYFDPFTGEGIWSALRGGELLAPYAHAAWRAAARGRHRQADAALRAYSRARRREFMGRWIVERLIAGTVATPFLMNRAAAALARRKDMADLLVGVTGDTVPASAVLTPAFLVRLAWGRGRHRRSEAGGRAWEDG